MSTISTSSSSPSPRLGPNRLSTNEIRIVSWVVSINYHCNSSQESLLALKDLASKAPSTEIVEIQDLVNLVKEIAQKKIYDPKLEALAGQALKATRLNFPAIRSESPDFRHFTPDAHSPVLLNAKAKRSQS